MRKRGLFFVSLCTTLPYIQLNKIQHVPVRLSYFTNSSNMEWPCANDQFFKETTTFQSFVTHWVHIIIKKLHQEKLHMQNNQSLPVAWSVENWSCNPATRIRFPAESKIFISILDLDVCPVLSPAVAMTLCWPHIRGGLPFCLSSVLVHNLLLSLQQWFSNCVPRNTYGPWLGPRWSAKFSMENLYL